MQADEPELHRELREAARAFLAGEGGVGRIRQVRDSEIGFDRDVWSRMAALGWLGAMVPESLGGLGLGCGEMAVIGHECGRVAASEPLVATAVLAARVLALGDGSGARETVLRDLIAGACIPVIAWQEVVGSLDPSVAETAAWTDSAGTRLNGVKRFVPHGLAADGFVVSAARGEGLALYWLARDTPGVEYQPQRRADGTEHGVLTLRDVRVSEAQVIASSGCGHAVLARAIDEAAVVAAAELGGIAARTLEITLDWLRTRVQFGKPIGSFQALQHRAVDLYIDKELCVSSLAAALATIGSGAEEARRAAAASRAKARASEAAVAIARKAIQMHGAIGFTDECDVGLYLKRALVQAAWLGNAGTHRRRYAALSVAA